MFIPDPERSDQGLIVLPNGMSVLWTHYDFPELDTNPQEEQDAWEAIYADMDDNGHFDDLNCSLQDGPPRPFNGDEPF